MQMKRHRAFTGLRYVAALFLVLGVVSSVSLAAPKAAVVGDWNGVLDEGASGKLHLVVHVTQKDDGSLTGTLDSLDQNANGILITTITYKNSTLHFECSSVGGSYDGKMNKDSSGIEGKWSQGGGSAPLNFTRSK